MKIKIDGIIGLDITSREVADELSRMRGKDITIEMASPGGLVREGITIFNLIRNHDGAVRVHLIGNVSSMGTYIALAGDDVTAEDNVTWMIHNPLNLAIGDYRVMQKNANMLDSLASLLARVYSDSAGKPMDEIRGLMDEESYFYGDEMVEAGFVDQIIENKRGKKKDTAQNRTEAVAVARVEFENCVAKMKESEEAKTDIEQAAAIAKDEIKLLDIKSKQKKGGAEGAADLNPANADNGQEDISMKTLVELMAENPALKAEVDARDAEKYNAGLEAGRGEVEARIKKAAPFLTADYPQAVKDLAVKVVTGDESEATLTSTVTVIDSMKEKEKEDAAAAAKLKETPGGGGEGGGNEDGSIASEEDYQAELAISKGEGGDK